MSNPHLYETWKDHPLVVFLVSFIPVSGKVPSVWAKVIAKTTEKSEIMHIQDKYYSWGVDASKVDMNLRGPELLKALSGDAMEKYIANVEQGAVLHKVSFPKYLETCLKAGRYIPKDDKSNEIISKGHILINTDLQYTETGTVEYSVTRVIRGTKMLIPPEYIKAHFGPDKSDIHVWDKYHYGMTNFFQVKELASSRKLFDRLAGLLWKTSREILSKATLRADFADRAWFPRTIEVRTDDEQPAVLKLSNPNPTPIETARRSNVRVYGDTRLMFPRSRRRIPETQKLVFPVFTEEVQGELEARGKMRPPVKSLGWAVPGNAEDGAEGAEDEKQIIVRALRDAYAKLTPGKTGYAADRAKAIEKAAGL